MAFPLVRCWSLSPCNVHNNRSVTTEDKKYLEDDPLDGLNVRHEGRVRSHHRDTEVQHGGDADGD